MITLDQRGNRVNKVHVDRGSLRDAETELEAIANDFDALITRLKIAADEHGCVYEQLTEVAEHLSALNSDNVASPLKGIKARLFWWEHDQ